MVLLPGGVFLMGTEDPEGFRADSEGPVREVRGSPFHIDAHAVSNRASPAYHLDAAHGEHEVRASTSRDGVRQSPGGTWTLPVRGALRIGPVSHNRSGATAEFDYVRTYAAP
uniref:SUMF1/EgtB/PvdO family nonheme iron enzyme n=1 Tax=Streptomyces sp. P9-2B-1 TaxID=3057115 RepID=UPI0033A47F21